MANSSSLQYQKKDLREQARFVLKQLPVNTRKKKARKIFRQVCALKAFQKAHCVMAYAALPEEVSTIPIIRKAWKLGKRVCFPKTNFKRGTMTVYRVNNLKDLKRGNLNLLEPDPLKAKRQNPKGIDLILVPGLAFDKRGNRLGRGKGYYDRFLRKAKQAFLIGLSFREQIVPRVPMTSRDIKVNKVIIG